MSKDGVPGLQLLFVAPNVFPRVNFNTVTINPTAQRFMEEMAFSYLGSH